MNSNIIVDCERMKYPHTGLYHYCRQISAALVSQKPPSTDLSMAFYVPKTEEGFLGKGIAYPIQKPWHKLYLSPASTCRLWHGTFQGTNYYPVQKRIKKVLTVHDLNFMYDSSKSSEKKKKYLHKTQQLIDRSDQLTVISNFTHQCVKEHLRISVPVTTIYNGCNLPDVATAFQQPGFITADQPFLFSIGTIAKKKNFHTLPALLKGNDLMLVIAGIVQDKAYLEEIIKEAKKHGVAQRVILPGAVTEAEKWWLLQHMQAFVFTSVAEGFGLPVVEAMSFGKPVLLSSYTSLPEIGGTAAYYFDSFDAAAMRDTLTQSLNHFYRHPQQSQLVKERAMFFSWDNAAKQYWNVYHAVLNGN